MKRILFFTFFGFRDYILDIKLAFENLNCTIYDTPYLKLKNDDNMTDNDIINHIACTCSTENIDCIFMFLLPNIHNYVSTLKNEILKKSDNGKYPIIFFYNFDDPKSVNIDLIKYTAGIDYLLTPNVTTVSRLKYILDENIKIIHLPHYFESWKYNINNAFSCIPKQYDICILYPDTIGSEIVFDLTNIIKQVKLLCVDNQLSIKLLGNTNLEDIYPDIYEGTFSISNIYDVTHDSKIIIYIKDNMMTENLIDNTLCALLACGSIVMTTLSHSNNTILLDESNCIVFDNTNYIKKLCNHLSQYNLCGLMSSNAIKTINNISINTWCNRILQIISS